MFFSLCWPYFSTLKLPFIYSCLFLENLFCSFPSSRCRILFLYFYILLKRNEKMCDSPYFSPRKRQTVTMHSPRAGPKRCTTSLKVCLSSSPCQLSAHDSQGGKSRTECSWKGLLCSWELWQALCRSLSYNCLRLFSGF